MKKRALLSENQVKYVEDIIVKRDTANLGMSRKEVIQVISELGQENIFSNRESLGLPHSGKADEKIENSWGVVADQGKTTEQSHICVSQQYLWHTMIEAEWEDLWQTNSPRDIFIRYDHYFQLNLDETCFLCN